MRKEGVLWKEILDDSSIDNDGGGSEGYKKNEEVYGL